MSKKKKIVLAYSGGLDTRCAVAWMSRHGMKVHAYTADLAQPDEANPADIPPTAITHGAVAGREGPPRVREGHGPGLVEERGATGRCPLCSRTGSARHGRGISGF